MKRRPCPSLGKLVNLSLKLLILSLKISCVFLHSSCSVLCTLDDAVLAMVASEVIIFNHFNPVLAVFAIFAMIALGLVGLAVKRLNSVGRELGDFFCWFWIQSACLHELESFSNRQQVQNGLFFIFANGSLRSSYDLELKYPCRDAKRNCLYFWLVVIRLALACGS